ncbi:MAG: hypothetical protein ACOH2O_21385 [Pseudomonas sp.]
MSELLRLTPPLYYSCFKTEYSELLKVGWVLFQKLDYVVVIVAKLLSQQATIYPCFAFGLDQSDTRFSGIALCSLFDDLGLHDITSVGGLVLR